MAGTSYLGVCVVVCVLGSLLLQGNCASGAPKDHPEGLQPVLERLVDVLERMTMVDKKVEKAERKFKVTTRRVLRRMTALERRVDLIEQTPPRSTHSPDVVIKELNGTTDGVTTFGIDIMSPQTTSTTQDKPVTIPTTTPYYDDSHCHTVPPGQMPLCQNYTGLVYLPTPLGHTNIEEIGLEVHQFFPLIKVQCSTYLGPFICRAYYPQCDPSTPGPVGPCRELCQAAKTGCEQLMNKFGFTWPESLECSKYPERGSGLPCLTEMS